MTKVLRIAVDDGHGLGSRERGKVDSGAVGNGHTEAAIAKIVGNEVRAELKRRGHAAMKPVGHYTTRDQQADAWRATALVSLHLNAGGGHGTETFVHSSAGATSKKIASAVNGRVVKVLGTKNRGVKTNGFAVLAGRCPAVLVEIAFIDSASDMKRLLASGMIRKVAHAIVDGLEASFGIVRKPAPKPAPVKAYVVTAKPTAAQYAGLAAYLKKNRIVASAKPIR